MDVIGEVLLQLFNQKKVKKWDQNVSRVKFFLFKVKFKKLGFSAPLTLVSISVFCIVLVNLSLTWQTIYWKKKKKKKKSRT